ncbi:MAG: HIT family protein [Candidatus Magasanikbacteria bacterium]|nr:HIT family protein [Candidatus Magasanikbacteria bacterium]NCS72400.1 HIT family protein [Candidatus Magasanikbacteria bacterium]
MDCIFCKIINGDIPNYTVYEDDHVLAFLDIHPHAKGHTVVIPKQHADTIFGLDDEYTQALMLGTQKAMEKIQEALGPEGFNVGWNHNEIAGQAVPHLHVHILPRWKNDGGKNIHAIINNPGNQSVQDIAALFNQ